MGDYKPTDLDDSLPDNKGEYEAFKDSRSESRRESKELWNQAEREAGSFWSRLFGKKDKEL